MITTIIRTVCLLLASYQYTMNCYAKTAEQSAADFGAYQETTLSSSEEEQLGKEFMLQVRKHLTLISDPIANAYIQNLGNRLVKCTDTTKQKFHFFIVNDQRINAFAGPAGHVGINSGLITATTNESELAAVMAHEIAHVNRHHLQRTIEKTNQLNIETTAALIVATLIGVSTNAGSDIATGAAMSALSGSTQQMLNISRDHEAEADRSSIKILSKAGFDPNAVPGFFEKMQQANQTYNQETPNYLLTHPKAHDRIADTKNHIGTTTTTSHNTSNAYSLIKARLQALSLQNSSQAVTQYAKLDLLSHNDATKYAYATALLQDRQFMAAKIQLLSLIAKNPKEILYQLALAQAETNLNNQKSALNILQSALSSHPKYPPLIQQYAESLIETQQFAVAKDFLEQQIEHHQLHTPTIYTLLAETYAKLGSIANAYQAKAKVAAMEGNKQRAITLLEQALKLPHLTSSEKANIRLDLLQLQKL